VSIGEARDQVFAGRVDFLCVGRNLGRSRRPDLGDFPVCDEDCLVVEDALAVHRNHMHVKDGNRRLLGKRQRCGQKRSQKEKSARDKSHRID